MNVKADRFSFGRNAVILNSVHVRAFAIQHEGAPPARLFFIPNGIDVADYRHPIPRAQLCVEFGVAADASIIGSVGRLTHQKGYDVLLDAMERLECGNVELILIGEGDQRAATPYGTKAMIEAWERVGLLQSLLTGRLSLRGMRCNHRRNLGCRVRDCGD